MEYLKARWLHANVDDPVWLFSEIGPDRYEIRKVEVWEDGRTGWADANEAHGSTMLGTDSVPPICEIATNPEFEAMLISRRNFERVWSERLGPATSLDRL
jgi:hypothetical protein